MRIAPSFIPNLYQTCRLLCLCWWIFYGSDTTFTIHLFGSRWMLCFITTRKAYYNQKKTFYDSNGLRPNIRRNFGTTILIEIKRKKTAYISTGWSGFWIKFLYWKTFIHGPLYPVEMYIIVILPWHLTLQFLFSSPLKSLLPGYRLLLFSAATLILNCFQAIL